MNLESTWRRGRDSRLSHRLTPKTLEIKASQKPGFGCAATFVYHYSGVCNPSESTGLAGAGWEWSASAPRGKVKRPSHPIRIPPGAQVRLISVENRSHAPRRICVPHYGGGDTGAAREGWPCGLAAIASLSQLTLKPMTIARTSAPMPR